MILVDFVKDERINHCDVRKKREVSVSLAGNDREASITLSGFDF